MWPSISPSDALCIAKGGRVPGRWLASGASSRRAIRVAWSQRISGACPLLGRRRSRGLRRVASLCRWVMCQLPVPTLRRDLYAGSSVLTGGQRLSVDQAACPGRQRQDNRVVPGRTTSPLLQEALTGQRGDFWIGGRVPGSSRSPATAQPQVSPVSFFGTAVHAFSREQCVRHGPCLRGDCASGSPETCQYTEN